MYAFFRNKMNRNAAITLTAFLYASMLVLVLYSAFEPQAELKYIAL
jgi:hypothetical protein